MKIIENTTDFYISEKTAVAIGKFDGFHRGHQKLLGQLEEQKKRGLKSVVFTFVPSPAAFFSREAVKDLSTIATSLFRLQDGQSSKAPCPYSLRYRPEKRRYPALRIARY